MTFSMGIPVNIFIFLISNLVERSEGLIEQTFIREPKDKIVIQGEDILLPCRVHNKIGMLQWTRDGFGLGSDRELIGFPRYTMVGNDEEDDYSLQITNAQLDDDAEFQCQVGAVEGINGIRSTTAVVTVLVPPEPPIILQGVYLETNEGMSVQLTCEAHGGRPAAELAWIDERGDVVKVGTEYKINEMIDGKRANAILSWTFVPERKRHLQNFTCKSENSALKQPDLVTITVDVKYVPKLNLLVHNSRILENDNVRLTCDVDANPPEVFFKWYRNDQQILNVHSYVFVLNHVTRANNGDIISCEVSNVMGTTKVKHTLNILYGPRIIRKMDDIETDIGDRVTLSCDIDSNPKPNITWTSEHSSAILGLGQVLIIPSINTKSAGEYYCTATASGFSQITENVTVLLKGPPIVTAPKTQFGKEGENIKVQCVITSVPKPSRVIWKRNSQVVANSRDYEIVEHPLQNGIRTLLIIHEAHSKDFGVYNCSVWNEYGHASMLIQLKRQETIPNVIIVFGVIGGIGFVITAIAVVVVCLKKRIRAKGSKFKFQSKGKHSDSTSARDSDLKAEVQTTSSAPSDNDPSWDNRSESRRSQEVKDLYKFTAEYSEPVCPSALETQWSNGFIHYFDYPRRYTQTFINQLAGLTYSSHHMGEIDPRFHADYANPCLRTSYSSFPSSQGMSTTTRSPFFTFPQKHFIAIDPSLAELNSVTMATPV
ncbi:irregular chiasm C-roughest protein-like [Tachypleus tridentatus]|uniref:irregular chiasm C-roughest protein-like n=1 Tax=Tachypleus tridentatus TaxID=6853 RepID=UPI003FCFC3B4